MAAWLEHCVVERRADHWSADALRPSLEARLAAAIALMAVPGADAFAACEREPRDDENPLELLAFV